MAKEVFEQIFDRNIDPEKYVEEKGLKTVNDEGALRETIEQIVADNPKSVEHYHNGKEKSHRILSRSDDESHEGQKQILEWSIRY